MADNPNMFLKLTGIEGESRAQKHENEIDILSFNWGLSQQGSAAIAGGAGTNRSDFHDMSFSKYTDKSSPTLAKFCSTGKVITEAKLTVTKAGDKPLEYKVITLNDCIISSFNQSGGGGQTTENFSLNYAKIKEVYTAQNDDGSAGKESEFEYDVKLGKETGQ